MISLVSTVGAVEVVSVFLVFCYQNISVRHSLLFIFVENWEYRAYLVLTRVDIKCILWSI